MFLATDSSSARTAFQFDSNSEVHGKIFGGKNVVLPSLVNVMSQLRSCTRNKRGTKSIVVAKYAGNCILASAARLIHDGFFLLRVIEPLAEVILSANTHTECRLS